MACLLKSQLCGDREPIYPKRLARQGLPLPLNLPSFLLIFHRNPPSHTHPSVPASRTDSQEAFLPSSTVLSVTCCSFSFLCISSESQESYTIGLASSDSMWASHVLRLLMFLSSCCTATSVSFSFFTLWAEGRHQLQWEAPLTFPSWAEASAGSQPKVPKAKVHPGSATSWLGDFGQWHDLPVSLFPHYEMEMSRRMSET